MPFGFGSRGNGANSSQRQNAFVQKVYPYSLRWILFFCSLLGLIWAIAMGVTNFRYTAYNNETSKQKLFDVLIGILYFVTAGIELWAMVASVLHKNLIAKPLLILGPLGVLVAVASQIIAVIAHFTLKGDKINQCTASYTGTTSIVVNGTPQTPSTAQAQSWCNDSWGRGTWSVFAWLVVVILVSILFCSIAMAYARQVADPSLVRSRQNNNMQSQAYQMQPQYHQQGGFYPPPPHEHQQAGQQQQGWMVPPYPGPPANPAHAPPQFEKNDYQPQAEWANQHEQELDYAHAPPSGSPPSTNPFTSTRPGREVIPNAEEDEAWERARTQGVTAHLTGHGSAPANRGGSGGMV